MKARLFLLPLLVVAAVAGLVIWAVQTPQMPTAFSTPAKGSLATDEMDRAVAEVDRLFALRWQQEGLTPAAPADDLQVLRRLSLCLHGTIPSLEEIRRFEADTGPDRLDGWTARMLDDARFGDYVAERLSRGYVGVEGGPFIIYRRDRFVGWLAGQLKVNRPYDEIVRQIIADEGLWTGRPATNFVTAAAGDGGVDENKLTARCVRAFLGQRIDCAQCHDHPFDHWTQAEFQGLAAHFGQTRLTMIGVEDKAFQKKKKVEYEVDVPIEPDSASPAQREKRVIPPAVPFHPEWLPDHGTRREKLAAWITHPENRRFERAIVNRVWGYLFGRPFVAGLPVDDLPDPGDPHEPDVLDVLGADFRAHGCDLKRLIRVITATRAFRMDSTHPADVEDGDGETVERLVKHGAVFPLTRLRPEQIIGAMIQAGSIKTINQNSHLVVRFLRFIRENNFVQQYGDLGEDELEERAGTLPQALLRMNGQFGRDILEAGPFTASGRIVSASGSDDACLEACFLVCLSRRPTTEERQHLLPLLSDAKDQERNAAVEDIYWSLFNAPEFSWNH